MEKQFIDFLRLTATVSDTQALFSIVTIWQFAGLISRELTMSFYLRCLNRQSILFLKQNKLA